MVRKAPTVLCVLVLGVALAQASWAGRLLTTEQALDAVFGSGCTITKEEKVLTGEALVRVTNKLGGYLHYKYGRRARTVGASAGDQQVPLTFYRAVKNGKLVGIALINSQPGKWGDVKFMIALNPDGAVRRVVVMSSNEKRGRPIARSSFLRQYEGKSSRSRLQVRKDIVGVSGATISSECATFAVKRAVLIYEELYLKAGTEVAARTDDSSQPVKAREAPTATSH